MPVTTKTKAPALLRVRRCKYCRGNFVPERPQDKDAKFCCPNHRKAFWRYGGLPFDKMKEQIMKDVRKLVRAELAEVRPELHPALDSLRERIEALEISVQGFKLIFAQAISQSLSPSPTAQRANR